MTRSTEVFSQTLNGTGSATEFPVNLSFWTADTIKVLHVDADGVETELDSNTDYELSGGETINGEVQYPSGATLTYPKLGSGLDILPATEQLFVYINLSLLQPTDLVNFASNVELIETALDKLTVMIQILNDAMARSVKVPISSGISSVTVPSPEDGKVLGWDGVDGQLKNILLASFGLVELPLATSNMDVPAFIKTLLDDTDAATARATLGASTVGGQVFTAASAGAARSAISAQENDAATAKTDESQEYTKSQNIDEVPLEISEGAVAWNWETQQCARLELDANATVSTPTNMRQGMSATCRFVQDATGNRTVSFSGDFADAVDLVDALESDANEETIFCFYYNGTDIRGAKFVGKPSS